jgi:hypothetical protein
MKEVKVIVRCDRCGGEDAQTYTEENSKGKPVEIDLDKPCHDEHEDLRRQYAEALERAKLILSPIVDLADEKGVKPEKATRPAARPSSSTPPAEKRPEVPRICLLCDETRDTDWSLRVHFQEDHSLSGSLVEHYGEECPVDGLPFPKIGHHVRQAHADLNLPHYSHVFLWAKKNGDPHGTLAKQIAALQKLANAA